MTKTDHPAYGTQSTATPPAETTLQRYQREYRSTVEAKIVRKVCRTLLKAGFNITHVYDGEQNDLAATTDEVLDLLANLDEGRVYFEESKSKSKSKGKGKKRGWVYIVNGNEWDALSDYTLNLEAELEPVMEWIVRHY